MIAYHVEKGADITVGVVEVPARESRHFGVLTATEWNRVTSFAEKPAQPDTLPGRPDTILASMGIYVFNTRLLEKLLTDDAADESSAHDFGKNVLPEAIDGNRQVFAYPFQDVKTRAQSYWRDVGTIDAYYDANLELVHVRPELNIYDEDWPIWTYQVQQPPAKFILDEDGRRGMAVNSMVSGGCIISGAVVRESLLFSNVRVEERTSIERSVMLPNVEIGRGCVITRRDHRRGLRGPRRHAASASTRGATRGASTSPRTAWCWSPPTCCARAAQPPRDERSAAPAGDPAVAHAPAAVPRRAHRPVRAAVDLPARHQGLHRHGGAPGGQPGGARGGELHPGADRAAARSSRSASPRTCRAARRCPIRCWRCSARRPCRSSRRSASRCCGPACARIAST